MTMKNSAKSQPPESLARIFHVAVNTASNLSVGRRWRAAQISGRNGKRNNIRVGRLNNTRAARSAGSHCAVCFALASYEISGLATCVASHQNGEEQHEKKFPARAPETTREGACAPQKSLIMRVNSGQRLNCDSFRPPGQAIRH